MDSKERIAKALQIATDTKVFEMAPGASEMAPDIFKKLFPGRKAVIVADINTWPALGEKVYGMFLSAGIKTDKYIIDKKEFHAEWKYIEMVDKEYLRWLYTAVTRATERVYLLNFQDKFFEGENNIFNKN